METIARIPAPEGMFDYIQGLLWASGELGRSVCRRGWREPDGFGIDLPNTNNGALSIDSGGFHAEAWQLIGYNSSALEHNIVEEITSAESVSTIKGLQRAYQRTLGLNSSGNGVSDDLFYVPYISHDIK